MYAKLTALCAALLLLTAGASPAHAGDFGIHIGKHGRKGSIGIFLGLPLGHARPCPPPVQREWTAGHWTSVTENAWVEGRQEQVWMPAQYATRHDACGRAYQVLVRPAGYHWVNTPGHWEQRQRQVWVPGGWRVYPAR